MRVITMGLVLCVSLACSSARHSSESGTQPTGVSEVSLEGGAANVEGPREARVQELFGRFKSVLDKRFQDEGDIEVSRESGLMQREFLTRGAETLVRDGRDDEATIIEAERGLEDFAKALLENTTLTSEGKRRIGEGSFAKASFKFCPRYPFC